MTIMYGIHNCDTVKKAIKWLEQEQISYQFYDLRKDGLTAELLESLANKSTWAELINKRSTTYRNLSDEIKTNLTADVAAKIVLEQPTLLKRPLLLNNDQLHLGFKPAQYQQIFNHE
ncbi:ArsC family reductase [Colwelliaceae bacterium BS250]